MNGCILISDLRMNLIYEQLIKKELNVIGIKNSEDVQIAIKNCHEIDFVILPMSGIDDRGFCRLFDQSVEILPFLKKCTNHLTIYTGVINPILISQNWTIVNMSQFSEVLNVNSLLTAEGVLMMLLTKTEKSIYEYTYDVVGYGHSGRAICDLLEKLQLKFKVISRSVDDTCPYNQIDYETWDSQKVSDIVINTAPTCVLNKERINSWNKMPIIIDISTRGIGVDIEFHQHEKVLIAPSLPSITAPYSAAACLVKLLEKELNL